MVRARTSSRGGLRRAEPAEGGRHPTRQGDDGRSEIHPTYVYGAAHSGTTILYKLLALHPDFAWFSQFSHRRGAIPSRRSIPLAHVADRALRSVRTHDWHKEKRPVARYVVPRPGEAHGILLYAVAAPTRAEAASRLRWLVDEECRLWSRTAFVAKPLPMMGHLDVLEAAHGNARLIHIVRDGRAVAASLKDKFMRSGESSREGVDQAASRWLDVLGEVERLQMPVLVLRYEDLCADVHGCLRRALAHAGVDPDAFPFSGIPTELTATNERRIRQLSDEELEAVQAAQATALRSFGYLDAPA
jgi:omega-hydroxy-beta-dihydromenaquinone-9 sulfotransferase